ncbi:DNA polymerase-3 subunit epsilon [Microbacterium halimionae]|uniref:DNA polymerase-3 subunit epsilon n=1 Tax=Microbacterium halimionae TaxID=1526413 RepID=A0A7W3PLP1_9MICO|nr:exonuclease domain-containing protein [Microbacterium halimionae]MBA8816206.1 DNA polymerase-3 subunit epsilon [Microbacterium halimionae]NII96408.1 DNA polymerase-3 subunit epsilon [Microbacterium halimionae]
MLDKPETSESSPLPAWAANLGVFDLETTGIDVARDRIVSAHVGVIDTTGRQTSSRTWLADPGVDIPAGATAVHGITTEHARRHGQPAADVVYEIVAALAELFAAGTPVVAYNAPFDFSLLNHEALRHQVSPLQLPFPVVDPLVLDKALDRYRRGKRTLESVSEHYDISLTGAHNAEADAVAGGRVAQEIARRYRDELPGSTSELHERQAEWAAEQAASLSEYFVRIGRIAATDPIDGRWPVR